MSEVPEVVDPDTDPFWAAVAERRLLYGRCSDCDGIVFYVRRFCPHCGSDEVALVESTGRGRVYTATVVRRHPMPALAAETPFVLAWVDFDEGFRLLTRVLSSVETPVIDMPVELVWHDHGGRELPCVQPVRP